MDQSFNEQELSDIMKEIEALEHDYGSGPLQKVSTVIDELAVATSTENILSWERPKAELARKVEKEEISFSQATPLKSDNLTSMTFKVQGNLALELKFDIGGKVVSLGVTEGGLTIELEGGVKFSVPVPVSESYKKTG